MLEIPAGKHDVEILYKEDTLICGFITCVAVEKSRQTLTFIAEPTRTYSPFTADDCSRTWYWLEDWGPYIEKSETFRPTGMNHSDFTKPVVAGEAPNKNSCEQVK